ncbi:MAG: hypothetical protein M1834_000804 [Cirrosporium novae-zelandiae]|nr:MAG: hypothetical protein M1834_000804 [Cirrosporium novae-zelandiae]
MGYSISKTKSSPVEDLVCSTCHGHLFNAESFREAWQKRISYTMSWRDIQEANQKGCAWCDMIFSEVDAVINTMQDQSQTQYSPESARADADFLCQKKIDIVVAFRHEGNGETFLITQYENARDDRALAMSCIAISTPSETDDEASRFIQARPLIYEMQSENIVRLARESIHECLRNGEGHENCPKQIKSSLPTRVLDCQDPGKPKLKVDTGGIEEPYVTLSYVWGEDQPQKTTTDNIIQYVTSGLNMNETPQTIKDAVHVTHKLQFRYLWIDSYCIIQDSADDKVQEIRNMRRIFQNAHLTIIAAKTTKVSIGFLQDCPRLLPTFVVPFFCPDGGLGTITLSPRAMSNPYEADKEPTNSRGWCLEERILTPRALIYASHTLQYLCQRGLLNIGNSFIRAKLTGIDRLSPRFFYPEADSSPPHTETMREMTKLWHRILQDFTPRALTAPKDRLKAIAGVAEEFHLRLKSRYVAGMWEHHLLGDLLWTKAGHDPLPGPTAYRAPSWSWASVDGIVYNPGPVVEPHEACCIILDYHVDLEHYNLPYGALKGGFLKVKARSMKMVWNPFRNLLYRSAPNGKLVIIGGGHPDRLEDVESEGEQEEVWALPLALRPPKQSLFSPRSEEDKLPTLTGMLLKVHDLHHDCFRRVALFTCVMQAEVEREFWSSEEQIITIL